MRMIFSSYTKKDGTPEDGAAKILQYLSTHKLKDVVVRLDVDNKKRHNLEEQDFFFPSLSIKNLEIKPLKKYGDGKFEATFDTKDYLAIFKLFLTIGELGNGGHSYDIYIGKEGFCFDGDGADRINSINGALLNRKLYDNLYDWPKIYNKDVEQKDTTQLTEAKLRRVIEESVRTVLKECYL